MKRFTESLRSSVANKDWYVALTSALTLPDVCGRLSDPQVKSQTRYAAWFNKWMGKNYTRSDRLSGPACFLTGNDCYALRCSYLHQGEVDITAQHAREALDSFHFVAPPPGWKIHNNRISNSLQLQVDVFCLEMADAVDEWFQSVAKDAMVQERMKTLLLVHVMEGGVLRI
ncbi:hypothetical protein [Pseudomonas prosekii]|uniref:hypothetical protein n=1 Tax=Pseudomonas prosekii TaxID=1148509 RepID=UPI003F7523AC